MTIRFPCCFVLRPRLIVRASVLLACALLTSCSLLLPHSENEEINIHVAYGHLQQPQQEAFPHSVTYELDQVITGHFFGRATARIVFDTIDEDSIPRDGLPKKAILILHFMGDSFTWKQCLDEMNSDPNLLKYSSYYPLGGDAYRGILPDTPENRKRIARLSVKELAENPRDKWLAKEQAVAIANKHLESEFEKERRRGCTLEIEEPKRSLGGYGWFMSFKVHEPDGGVAIGHWGGISVGDDAKVKDVGGLL